MSSAGPLTALRSNTALILAAALSLVAAIIHLWVAPQHLEAWWGYGIFFLAAAGAQGLYALVLLRWPSPPVLLVGVAGNLAVVILWFVTRTTGIPLFGPHAGEIEDLSGLDLACTLAEVGVVGVLAALAMERLSTQGRIQVVVVLVVSALFFWHFLHLLAGLSAH